MLTLGSLFDGISTWQIAATNNGIKPIWSSEIDAFPMAVSKHHFPDTKQLGDITKINGAEIEPVDIICSGSPCQSFSVAGKHTGLDGVSGIFYEFVRIVKEMQDATNGVYPKFVVWENVTGVFSSNKGEDIKAVLNAFDELGYVLDMNILDAQYMGVPQRRRRVFAVWQNVNIIRQMRTDTSFSIITQMLTEILLCLLNEVLNLSEKGRKDSVWRQRKLSEDGLLKKMKLFGIVEKIKFEKLLNDWGEISRKQLQEQESLVALSDEKGEPLHEGMTRLELIRQLDEELFGSIDTLWKNLLADLYKKEKLFTTLTQTSEITDQTICTCAKILENISWLTIRLARLSANFYETEQLVLMARKELTKYANERQGSYTLFEPMGGVQCWDDYLTMVSDQRQLLIADIRKRSERQVLPVEQGVPRDSAESEGEREETATDVGASIDSASYGVITKGNGEGILMKERHCSLACGGGQAGQGYPAVLDTASGFKYRQGAKAGGIGWQNGKAPTLELSQNCAVYESLPSDCRVKGPVKISPACTAKWHKGSADTPLVMSVYENHAQDSRIKGPLNVAPTVSATFGMGGNNTPIIHSTKTKIIENHPNDSRVKYKEDNVFQTLSSRMGTGGGNVPMVHTIAIEGNGSRPSHKGNGYKETDKMYTLNATEIHGIALSSKTVRRLTCLECERLMGLPDSWTDVEFNGKPAPDSKRYKAIGNGMAVPCSDFIMKRISEVAND